MNHHHLTQVAVLFSYQLLQLSHTKASATNLEDFVYQPLPGLSLLKAYSPTPQRIFNHSNPLILSFEDKHAAHALITIALTCAFGLRSKSVLRPSLFSSQVRRHVSARLRRPKRESTTGFKVESFHFNVRHDSTDTLLIDVYGTVRTTESSYAYVAAIEKPADSVAKLESLRIV